MALTARQSTFCPQLFSVDWNPGTAVDYETCRDFQAVPVLSPPEELEAFCCISGLDYSGFSPLICLQSVYSLFWSWHDSLRLLTSLKKLLLVTDGGLLIAPPMLRIHHTELRELTLCRVLNTASFSFFFFQSRNTSDWSAWIRLCRFSTLCNSDQTIAVKGFNTIEY